MLSNQLLIPGEAPRLVANHALLAGHQQIDEVVDHDRHLDAINGGEHAPILRQLPARATQLRTEMPPRFVGLRRRGDRFEPLVLTRRRPRTSSHGDAVTAAAATMTNIAVTVLSMAITFGRPSATAKPM